MMGDYLTFSSNDPFTIRFSVSDNTWDGSLQWASGVAGTIWMPWYADETIYSEYDGTRYSIHMRGSGNTFITDTEWMYDAHFILDGNDIRCDGNIETLLDYGLVGMGEHPTMAVYCYANIFYGCTGLTSAPELPATTLTQGCYYGMFTDCTGLTSVPQLPATTLTPYCYAGMFYGCAGLTSAPELPATTLDSGCYRNMFQGCTGLASAPELPATTLAANCYENMFSGCTGLTSAPELPTIILATYCYASMFRNCTGLTSAPELPATTLASNCYSSMFYGCIGLASAPELPATTLAASCYESMFRNCTGLTSAPELPATALVATCYRYMFRGCSSIKLSTTQSNEYPTEYRIPSVGEGGSLANSMTSMFSDTGGTFTGTPVINTVYYGAWVDDVNEVDERLLFAIGVIIGQDLRRHYTKMRNESYAFDENTSVLKVLQDDGSLSFDFDVNTFGVTVTEV